MLKSKTFLYIGIWLIVMPLFGIPGSWKIFLTVLTGAVVVFLSLKASAKSVAQNREKVQGGAFVENSEWVKDGGDNN